MPTRNPNTPPVHQAPQGLERTGVRVPEDADAPAEKGPRSKKATREMRPEAQLRRRAEELRAVLRDLD